MRTLNIRGRYQGFPGIVSYSTESTEVIVEAGASKTDKAAAKALQEDNDQKAAEKATTDFFFRRIGTLVDYEVINAPTPTNKSLAGTDGFEGLLDDDEQQETND